MTQPAAAQPNLQQLIDVIAQQQTQINQLINVQRNNQPNPAIIQTIPSMPDVAIFEQCDEKHRITEWLERFTFAIDSCAPNAADDIKVKALMNKLSESAFSEYSKFVLPAKVTDFDFDETIAKLEKLFSKPQSIFVDRFACLMAAKDDGEEFQQFVNRHKRLLKDFQFDKLNEEQFKGLMLLTALKSSKDAVLRQRILAKLTKDGDAVKYDELIEDCINFLSTIHEAKLIEATSVSSKTVNAVKPNQRRERPKPQPKQGQPSATPTPLQCWRCGKTNHTHRECSHKSAKCPKCRYNGHLENQCEKVQEWRRKNFKVKKVGTLSIGMALKSINSASLIKIKVLLNGRIVKFILDSGAEINVIDEETYRLIGQPKIWKCAERGRMFDGTEKSFIGKGEGHFEFQGVKVKENFYVAEKGSMNLLSVQTMDAFGLLDGIKAKINSPINLCSAGEELRGKTKAPIKSSKAAGKPNTDAENQINQLKQEYTNVFKNELGLCSKVKAHLELKTDAQPKYRKARPVPYNAKDAVDGELDRWEKMGVIGKVEHTEWAAPILVVKKADGSARLCIDYSTGLNNALKDHQHPLPLPEDIFATLNGGQYFSQIDLRDAYLQVELDEASKKLCAIATHRGNYEVKRLPFGIKTAPGIFQSIMDQMLADFDFATAYLDDIIIVSKGQKEHSEHLKKMFSRFQEWGFRVKREKCSFFQDEIKYLGQIIDKNGRRPDPSKITAISEMPEPTDVSSLRSYLGMVNHYQQFIKNMRFVRKPLDDLLKKDTEWNWSDKCKNAFDKIKEILSSELLLTHYDPLKEIIVAADASDQGIGAVISHKFPDGTMKAIAHASSALTPAEKNYSQIEKEALAIIFAVQKFHKMIYGRKFTLLTDHKPLLAIFGNKKGVRQCSANRLLRWSLILLAYDFTIEYVNTNDFGQADALSRLIAKGKDAEDRVIANTCIDSELESIFVGTIEKLPIKFGNIVESSKSDQNIKKVMKFIRNGWPQNVGNENVEIRIFHQRKEQLSITKDCLMYAERVVIPTQHRAKILQLLHKGHPGMKRMKQLAREYAYWPKMDQEIEQFVENCQPCQNEAKAPTKTHLHSWPKTNGPWQRVHIDFAGPFFGKEYLIIVDAYSKYPEVFEMPTKSTSATIEKLRYLFSRHGLPETLVSDNGTQFTSHEFAKFTNVNGIKHLFSAPYNPMSNGQAERFVDTFKRTFRKLKGEGAPSKSIVETFLVSYRTTPNDSLEGSKSPAEMFLGRKPRTTLDLLKPTPTLPIERNEEMEQRFNRRYGTKIREFAVGDNVYAKHRISQNWKFGKVSKKRGVIYDVDFLDGSSGRFHANQLRPRHTADEADQLQVFLDAFDIGKPADRQIANDLEARDEHNQTVQEQGLENDLGQSDNDESMDDEAEQQILPRRYPQRNRRAPQRYTP